MVDVTNVVRAERRGGFAVRQLHLAVGVWNAGKLHVVDRDGVLPPARNQFRVLEDRTARICAGFNEPSGTEWERTS